MCTDKLSFKLLVFYFVNLLAMDEVVEDFIESPVECGLDFCTKKQLIRIAEYYKVDIGDARKTKVKIVLKIV